MTRIIDVTGLLVALLLVIRALLLPGDEYWLAALATVACFWIALRTVVVCSCGNRLWPAPGLLFLLLCLVTNHLGAFDLEVFYYKTSPESAWQMIWVFNLAYLGFAMGVWICSKLRGGDPARLVDRYYSIPITNASGTAALVWPAMLLYLAAIGMSLVIMRGQLPLLAVIKTIISGRLLQASLMAVDARNLLYTVAEYRFQGYINQIRIAMLPMITLLWFTAWRVSGRQLFKWLTIVCAVLTSFMLMALLERSGLVLFIIQVVIVSMLIKKPQLSMRLLLSVAGGLFGTLLILSILLGRGASAGGFGENLILQAEGTLRRIYITNALSSAKTFDLFPATLDFRWGLTWLVDLRNLLPGPGVGLSREIYTYMWEGSGNAVPHFIAEMWANGGYSMVLFASMVTGAFMHWLSFRLLNVSVRTPLSITFTALIIFSFALLGFGGFLTPISRGLLMFLIMYFIFNRFLLISRRISPGSPATQQTAPAAFGRGGGD